MTKTISEMCDSYENKKAGMNFFDANCWWDPTHFNAFEKYKDFNEFYASLANRGIKKAVITAAESRIFDADSGNESMLEYIRDKENLYGAMVLTPDYQITGDDIKAYIDRMVENKAVIARIFPKSNRHSMKSWIIGDLLKNLNDRRIPLMIWHNETSWDTIDAICSEYPSLPVIVEGNDVKLLYHNRHYIPLYKKHKNLYLETHNVILYNEVDYFAQLDAERLIYGSYYQYNTPDAAMSQIIMGEFDEEEKQLIAHGNLERLVSGII